MAVKEQPLIKDKELALGVCQKAKVLGVKWYAEKDTVYNKTCGETLKKTCINFNAN